MKVAFSVLSKDTGHINRLGILIYTCSSTAANIPSNEAGLRSLSRKFRLAF